jgi:hypothetical protein
VLAPDAASRAARILARLPQPFTTAEARQALGTTRRVAIPLLEYMDRAGITQRLPDDRRRLRLRGADHVSPKGKRAGQQVVRDRRCARSQQRSRLFRSGGTGQAVPIGTELNAISLSLVKCTLYDVAGVRTPAAGSSDKLVPFLRLQPYLAQPLVQGIVRFVVVPVDDHNGLGVRCGSPFSTAFFGLRVTRAGGPMALAEPPEDS